MAAKKKPKLTKAELKAKREATNAKHRETNAKRLEEQYADKQQAADFRQHMTRILEDGRRHQALLLRLPAYLRRCADAHVFFEPIYDRFGFTCIMIVADGPTAKASATRLGYETEDQTKARARQIATAEAIRVMDEDLADKQNGRVRAESNEGRVVGIASDGAKAPASGY